MTPKSTIKPIRVVNVGFRDKGRNIPTTPHLKRNSSHAEVVRFIEGHSLFADYEDSWPSFHDAEILGFTFDRGNISWIFDNSNWEDLIRESLEMSFMIMSPYPRDQTTTSSSGRSKWCVATVRFESIYNFRMTGLSYQNVVDELKVSPKYLSNLKKVIFRVKIDGMQAIQFECEAIRVLVFKPILDSVGFKRDWRTI